MPVTKTEAAAMAIAARYRSACARVGIDGRAEPRGSGRDSTATGCTSDGLRRRLPNRYRQFTRSALAPVLQPVLRRADTSPAGALRPPPARPLKISSYLMVRRGSTADFLKILAGVAGPAVPAGFR